MARKKKHPTLELSASPPRAETEESIDELLDGVPSLDLETAALEEAQALDVATGTPATPEAEQAFLDRVAIALFARGLPLKLVWTEAEKLLASRRQYLGPR